MQTENHKKLIQIYTTTQTHNNTPTRKLLESMFHLPDVLIDYIYSFDDNAYYKRNYRAIVKELDMWYSWRRTSLFLYGKHNTYKIYHDHHVRRNSPVISLSQYILWVAKNYSDCVYVNNMKWKLKNTNHKLTRHKLT